MYKRISAVLLPIALVALVGLGVWGYQENTDKNAILIKAESQYQRSFHELTYHVNQLRTELGNMVAVNPSSQDYYRRQMINVWRITNDARNDVTQLPVALMPLNKTQELLHNLARFSYGVSIRNLSEKPMTDSEKKTLSEMYKRSKEISAELDKVQNAVIVRNLRWMDVETALASQEENTDNVIIDGFRALNKRVEGYSEVDWGPSIASREQRRNLQRLPGRTVGPSEIRRKAAAFLGNVNPASLKVSENGKGTRSHSYTVTASRSGGRTATLDYSAKGGHLMQYMNPRGVNRKVLDDRRARDAALAFLDRHRYPDMEPVAYDEYSNTASITFASRQGGVIVYPEKVMVNVALDNGEVTDMRTADYHFEHKSRKFGKPKLTREQARKELSPRFDIMETEEALIENEVGDQVRCYQFTGRMGTEMYKIFINADTGYEEQVENLRREA